MVSRRLIPFVKQSDRTVFNPIEQRIYALIQIATGLVSFFAGTKRTPSWTLAYAMRGAQRAYQRREAGKRAEW